MPILALHPPAPERCELPRLRLSPLLPIASCRFFAGIVLRSFAKYYVFRHGRSGILLINLLIR